LVAEVLRRNHANLNSDTSRQKPRKNKENFVTVSLFFTLVFLLSITTVSRLSIPGGTYNEWENRELKGFPDVGVTGQKLESFPERFQTFFDDRFSLRDELVSWIAFLKLKLINVSHRPTVIAGRSGWLYLFSSECEETIRRTPLFSDSELHEWTTMLEQRRIWLQKRGIRFLFVIAPDKSEIYPEYIPREYTRLWAETRAEQLMKYIQINSSVEAVYLKLEMAEAKAHGQLYFKYDTHWNDLGGYYAYSGIMKHLVRWFPNAHPIPISNVQIRKKNVHGGDLARITGAGTLLTEEDPFVQLTNGYSWHLSNYSAPYELSDPRQVLKPFATDNPRSTGPRVYFIRDSFLTAMQPFFSESCKRAYYLWSPGYEFSTEQIKSEKPDILIQEMVEHNFYTRVPANPASLMDSSDEQRPSLGSTHDQTALRHHL